MTVYNIDLADSTYVSMGTHFRIVECGACHIVYGMPVKYFDNRRKDHGEWRCPNPACDSTWSYSGDSPEEKLRKELSKANERYQRERIERQFHEKSARAYKGKVTQIKTRIVNGVCPCCNRSFRNVRLHMETKHPDFSVKLG